ncbi:MAG: type II toxin-antitoxin system RelE/ParE family toxin [Candidatus Acidiferrales bacterium]
MNIDQGFELHPGAVQDITEIWEFIARDSPSAATHVREEILEAIRKLLQFPRQGHERPDLSSRPLRFQTVRDYLIVCAPDERPLIVIAALHGRRSPRIIAAALRGRE